MAAVTLNLAARCNLSKIFDQSEALLADGGLRTTCVNVRMSQCEIQVLDDVCRALGGKRAPMLRALALSNVPSPIPHINQGAFNLLASIDSDLRRLVEAATRDGGSVDALTCLQRIEEHMAVVRASMLGVSLI